MLSQSDGTNPGSIHYADINASYDIDSLNLLSASFGGYFYKLNVQGDSRTSLNNTSFPDAIHLQQFVGVVLYHIKSVQSKAGDDKFGEFRTDALYKSAAQILLNAYDGSGKGFAPRLGSELSSIALIHPPLSFDYPHRA